MKKHLLEPTDLLTYLLPAHLEAHPAEEALGEVDGSRRGQRVAAQMEVGVAAAL